MNTAATNTANAGIEMYWNTSGDYDFIMKIYVSDMKRYQDFVLNTLGVVESIGSLHSFFVIGTVKSGIVPIPKAE